MPTGNLPAEGKKLWEEVYQKAKKGSCKDAEDVEQCAAGSAWKAVKNAGWHKVGDQWKKSADTTEFSLTIRKATYDEKTNEMRWTADTSDTGEDSYGDNMTLELFSDFLSRIAVLEQPPEQFCSDFWKGGTPYLSISHYHDQNGQGVPGVVDAVYIDGNVLKAKGRFSDSDLGRACFRSVCESLHSSSDKPKVRISIAFLDYKHVHKSTGVVFERKTGDEHCKDCLREAIAQLMEGTAPEGKTYLKGHLIHFALTRVPVNKRTIMEVDKSMTTQIEDAESIVGEELAKKLAEQEKEIVGKSEALVIKAEDGKCPKCGKELVDGKCPECDEEEVEEGCAKKKKSDYEEQFAALNEKVDRLLSMLSIPEKSDHKLDSVFAQFRSDFDSVLLSDTTPEEKLSALQPSINAVGEKVVELVRAESKPVSIEKKQEDAITQLSEVVATLAQKMEFMSAQLENVSKPAATVVNAPTPIIPERRSINPASVAPSLLAKKSTSETPKLRALVDRSVGL